jgi:hypothetical protein
LAVDKNTVVLVVVVVGGGVTVSKNEFKTLFGLNALPLELSVNDVKMIS